MKYQFESEKITNCAKCPLNLGYGRDYVGRKMCFVVRCSILQGSKYKETFVNIFKDKPKWCTLTEIVDEPGRH